MALRQPGAHREPSEGHTTEEEGLEIERPRAKRRVWNKLVIYTNLHAHCYGNPIRGAGGGIFNFRFAYFYRWLKNTVNMHKTKVGYTKSQNMKKDSISNLTEARKSFSKKHYLM